MISEQLSKHNALLLSHALVEFDLSGGILSANEPFLALMGYSLEELIGRHHSIFVSVDYSRSPEYQAFWAQLRDGRFQAGEFRRFTKSGGSVYLQGSYNPVLDDAGHPCKILGIAQDITERKHRDVDYQNQLIAIAHSQAMVEFDMDGYVTQADSKFLNAIGYTLTDIVGWQHSMFLDPVERTRETYQELWIALREGEYRAANFRLAHKFGHDVWIQATYIPVLDMYGKPTKVVQLASDITAEIPQSDAFEVLARMSDALVVIDRLWRFKYANERALQIFGREGENVVGKNIWDLNPYLIDSPLYAACHRALAEGTEVEIEEYYPQYSCWIESRIFPARCGVTILFSDVSQRRVSAQLLRLRDKALHSSRDGIVIVDALSRDMPIIYVNEAFSRLTGYDPSEVIGRNCRFMQGEQRRDPSREVIRMAIESQSAASAILCNFRKDGSMFFNELRIEPVRDEAGLVTHFIGSQTDVSDRIRYEKELEYRANYDSLTGLPNRKLLEELLGDLIVRSRIRSDVVGVAFLDLDNFKDLNDTLGHVIGDSLLRAMAKKLKMSVRRGDIVARLGGDEFAIVCPGLAELSEMEVITSKVYESLHEPVKVSGHLVDIDASIGLSAYPEHGDSVIELLKCADVAMYAAKTSGRGTLALYSPSMGAVVAERTQIERDLRTAIANNELALHYQPKFAANTREVSGMEALLRWNHPMMGLIGPSDFIEIAESSKLIVPIGEWVLRQACIQNKTWIDAGLSSFPISVNVSVKQLNKPGFYETVERSLAASNLPGSLLDLEITESVAMNRPDLIIPVLHRIKELGVTFSIDDFGTGYSSLSYIKDLPIDCLKIDRSFVRDIMVDSGSAAICRTIISMAHHLALKVVAEGVESEEQANYLRTHKCDEIQGYLMSRPETVECMESRLVGYTLTRVKYDVA